MIINQNTQKKALVTAFLILIIFGLSGWLISEIKPKFLTNTGWFLLLITIGLIIWSSRHIEKKSTTKQWLGIAIILCVILIFNYSSCSRKDQIDTSGPKDLKKLEQTENIKAPAPLRNPSIMTKTDFGRIVRYTAQERDGVKLYNMTNNGDQYEIALIGKEGIVDNPKTREIWPVWGADRFLRGWKKYFPYERMGIMPNAIVIIFGGKPRTVPMDNRHILTFPRGKRTMVVTSPGGPMYLWCHEPIVNGSDYCFTNNDGSSVLQVTKLT